MKSELPINSNIEYGTKEKTIYNYMKGFTLCVILTLVPFFIVSNSMYSYSVTVIVVYITAIMQFFVQLVYFLRLNYTGYQAKMNVLSFAFTILLLSILVFGSLWIMWNLNYNMMH